MLYPNTDHEIWAQRYGLKIKAKSCPNCGNVFETTIPFAIKGYRGLQAREHACGPEFVYSVLKAVDKEEVQFWLSVKYGS